MDGRIVGLGILGTAALAGALMWWLQVYAYYDSVTAVEMPLEGQAPLPARDFAGIDSQSSPIRYRASFQTAPTAAGEPYPGAEPLVAPFWFDCFDAGEIGAALASGQARAVLSRRDVHPGVDRVVALFADGRAYAWQQFNPSWKD